MRYKPFTPEQQAEIAEKIRALHPMPVAQMVRELSHSQKTIMRCYPRDIEEVIVPLNLAELPDSAKFDWDTHRADFIIMEAAA